MQDHNVYAIILHGAAGVRSLLAHCQNTDQDSPETPSPDTFPLDQTFGNPYQRLHISNKLLQVSRAVSLPEEVRQASGSQSIKHRGDQGESVT